MEARDPLTKKDSGGSVRKLRGDKDSRETDRERWRQTKRRMTKEDGSIDSDGSKVLKTPPLKSKQILCLTLIVSVTFI